MPLPFLLIDAFTETPLAGNPCAVVLDADDLSDAQMQRLAQEFNQSETAFVQGSSKAGFGVRFFTPAEEIPLAGHPTIATVAALLHTGRLTLSGPAATLSLELKEGPIQITVLAPTSENPLPQIRMTQRKPAFGAVHEPEMVAPLFGLKPEDIYAGSLIQTVSTGTPMLIMMLRDHAALRRAQVSDFAALARYREASDFFSPHLFCLGGATPAGATFARQFGLPPDLAEDPVTGSATGSMAAYLWRYGYLAAPEFVAEQGHWLGRPGRISVLIEGPREDIKRVTISGTGVVVLEGNLLI